MTPKSLHLRWTRQRSARPGVVIVIMLVAILLLAAVVFYVLNIGQHLDRRVRIQNASDATAIAAANTMARTFNTVALNNVATARMIGMINILDSLPMAIDFSVRDLSETELNDVEAERQVLEDQLDRGVVDEWAERMLRRMADPTEDGSVPDLDRELVELDTFFRTHPDFIPDMTHFNAPSGGQGSIWEAMYALDALSQLSLLWMPIVVQETSIDAGERLLGEDPERAQTFTLPIQADVPWDRGVFNDYERPVRFGLLPGSDDRLWADDTGQGFGQVDHTLVRRGPFDAVYGWRRTNGHGPHSGGHIPGPGAPPVGSTPSPGSEPTEYYVYGTHQWMQQQLPNWWRGGATYDRVTYWLDRISDYKLRYVFRDPTPRTIIRPEWEIDPETDNQRSNDGNEYTIYGIADGTEVDEQGNRIRINETFYIVVEIKSRIPNNPGNQADQGDTWQYIQRSGFSVPFTYWASGWQDPRNGPPFAIRSTTPVQWRQLNDFMWRASATYETEEDRSIGLPRTIEGYETLEDGTEIPIYVQHTVYWEMDFLFGGINIGPPVEVPNPYAGFDPNASDAPAPYDLIHDQMEYDFERNVSPYLRILGIGRHTNAPAFWPGRFGGGDPYDGMVGLSEALVFNNHSVDLWTPMWHGQLKPIEDYQGWVEMLRRSQDDSSDIPGLDTTELPNLQNYLQGLEPAADLMLSH